LEYLKIINVKPNLILIFVVCAALLNKQWEGAAVGFLAGLSLDMASGDVLGFHSLLFMYTGIGIGFISRYVFKDNFLIVMLVTFVTSVVYGCAVFFLKVFPIAGDISMAYPFLRVIIPEAAYSAVVSVFIYAFMIKLNRKMERLETV